MPSFITEFDIAFAGICERFGFVAKELSKSEVALQKEDFAIIVYQDRDGAGMHYFRRNKESGEISLYLLADFLASKRQWVVSGKNTARIGRELDAYALTLEQSAEDILSGSDSWIHQNQPQPYRVGLSTRKALGF